MLRRCSDCDLSLTYHSSEYDILSLSRYLSRHGNYCPVAGGMCSSNLRTIQDSCVMSLRRVGQTFGYHRLIASSKGIRSCNLRLDGNLNKHTIRYIFYPLSRIKMSPKQLIPFSARGILVTCCPARTNATSVIVRESLSSSKQNNINSPSNSQLFNHTYTRNQASELELIKRWQIQTDLQLRRM